MRSFVLVFVAVLLVSCGSSAPPPDDGPIELWVAIDMSSSSRVQGRDWSATACAGEDCKTYSPASCEIALSSDCFIGVGVTVVFPYPHRADMPGALSVDIVSDSGQKLYSTERPNHCRTEGNICEATIAIP